MKIVVKALMLSVFYTSVLLSEQERDFAKLWEQSTARYKPKRLSRGPTILKAKDLEVHENPISHVFTIAPHSPKKNISWRVYHKGQILSDREGIFQFSADSNRTHFTLAIATIKPPQTSIISNLEVPKGIPFICYTLTKHQSISNKENFYWSIETTRGTNGLTITQDALVVILPPEHIETLHAQPWTKTSTIVMLPTLVLKNTKELPASSVKSMLAALDTDPLHSRSCYETQDIKQVRQSREILS